jgi:lipoprotein-anchoring transpeptidase ErfK/SrfK
VHASFVSRLRAPLPCSLALVAGVALFAAGCGAEERTVSPAALVPAPASTVEIPTASPAGGAPAPSTPEATSDVATAPTVAATAPRGRLTVQVTRPVGVRAQPGGAVVARLGPKTEFGSPTVLPVVRRRGSWIGVLTTALPNGQIGWISASAALVPFRTYYRIDASLRRREIVVRRAGQVVQRFPIAIGSPTTPTPTGRFAVTDKLLTTNAASPYGCCILALSATQAHTPQGWGGGDRVAIHATNLPETIGTAASLGCMRAPADEVRRAVDRVPLGTLVRVRA